MKSTIENILNDFETIALEKVGKVSFLKRCDFKYILTLDQIKEVLEEVRTHYYIMSIKGSRTQSYLTTYYDTDADLFYNMHHNGKNNRFKVRKRIYETSHDCFFEIKRKRLNGTTKKKRIEAQLGTNMQLNNEELQFVDKIIPLKMGELKPKLDTHFTRVTVVSKELNERVTIDLNLNFRNAESGSYYATKNLVVIEVKCDKFTKQTHIRKVLKSHGIRPMGFSKYCIGRAVTNELLKRNRFKQKLKLVTN